MVQTNGRGNTAEYEVEYYRPDVGGNDHTTIRGYKELRSFAQRVDGVSIRSIYRNGKSIGASASLIKEIEIEVTH